MLRNRSFGIARGVGGWSKNILNDVVSNIKYARDKSNQNMTRDFVIGNDYDYSETDLSNYNKHKDSHDPLLLKNNSGQIGSGIRRQKLYNLKRKKYENNSGRSNTNSCSNGCSGNTSNCTNGCSSLKKSKREPKRMLEKMSTSKKSGAIQIKRKRKKEEGVENHHHENCGRKRKSDKSKSLKFDTSVYCKKRHKDNFARDIFKTL